MAFSYNSREYHEICNKIYHRAIKAVKNELPEALRFNNVDMILEIYIKVFRARSKLADDNEATTRSFQRLCRLQAILKHFLNINDCFEDQRIAYDFNQKQMVFLDEDEDVYDVLAGTYHPLELYW